MSLYLLLYVYIVIFACVSWFLNKKVVNFISFVTLIILFLFLAMRYGQGVDYFGYEILFNYWKNTSNIDEFIKEVNNIHGEYLWSWLGYVFNNILKLDFQYFVCLLAIIGIYELYCYLNCYCRANKMWAILLAFPTLYLTYMFNAMRQGIVICTFMGIMLPLLVEKKFFKYYFCTLIMLFVHTSAIVFFAIPFLIMFRVRTLFIGLSLTIILGGTGIVLGSSYMTQVISTTIPVRNLLARIGYFHVFLPAVAERIFMFALISYLYYRKRLQNSKTDEMFYRIYICSLMLYFLFIGYSLVASRLSIAPRIVEIALIVNFLNKLPKIRSIICCIILILNVLMYCKNIDYYIKQGGYQNINILNYPYVSIYNKDMITRVTLSYVK